MKKFSIILFFTVLLMLIIPIGFASDNSTLNNENMAISADNEVLSLTEIYFNSSVESDGDGSQSSPYKYLSSSKIQDNSIVHFADGEYTLDSSKSVQNLTIIGQSPLNTIIKGNSLKFISQGNLNIYTITLNDLTVNNNKNFTAVNVIFENNDGSYTGSYSNIYGGALYSNGGNTIIESSTFRDNTATYGGAVYVTGGSLTVVNSIFESNYANKYGGAIAGEANSNIIINDTDFTKCYTINNAGGALYVRNSVLNIKKSNFTSCNATLGGAICDLESNSVLDSIIANNNVANYQGGAVYKMYGTMEIKSSSFSDNKASSGGALFLDNSSDISVKLSKFISNQAAYEGGAVFTILNIKEDVSSNTYKNNRASQGNDYYNSPGYNMFLGNGNYTMIKGDFSFNGTIPSSYDLREHGWVTPVKSQKSSGNCWAFSSLGALESCILKATGIAYDLCEENMKNLMSYYSDYGWSLTPNKGGYDDMGIAYLVNWLGVLEDDMDTYSDQTVISPVFNSTIHVQNLVFLTRSNYTDNDEIKEAILKYGAVSTGIYYSSSNLKSNSYYYSGTSGNNHAVVIVGWDDNYSKSNFKTTPPGDGAWICKNSWGETWGDKGYFYVSYYDTRCPRVGDYQKCTYTIILNDTMHYDKNYQYDIIGITDYLITGNDTIWYQNIFNASDNEFLTAFSTYFNATTNWTAQIYVNDALKLTQSGISTPGYYTFNLNEFIPLQIGDTFRIVMKISCDEYASVPISEKIRSNRVLYREGISFFSYDGLNWTDLYDFEATFPEYGHSYYSQVACLKAFTSKSFASEISLNTPDLVAVGALFNVTAIIKDEFGNYINSGNVKFTINSKTYNVPVVFGQAVLKTQIDSTGSYIVTADYSDNHYSSSNASARVNISDFSVNLTISISDITCGEELSIQNTLISDNKLVDGYINVNVGDNTFVVPSNTLTLVKNALIPGEYLATASYSDKAYANATFKVSKIPLEMNLNITKTDVDSVNITASFSKPINGTVRFDVNSKLYHINATGGIAVLTLTALDYGNYNVKASFSSIIYKNVIATGNFSVDYIKTHFRADDLVMYYRDGSRFYVTLLDKDNKPLSGKNITINLNGVDSKRTTDASGTASMAINLNSGVYNASISYLGDEIYIPSNLTRSITVKSTVLSSDVVKYYRNATQYYATILDFKGNPVANTEVTMNINGVFYKRITNSEGVVRLNLNLEPNTYILTVYNPVTGENAANIITVLSRLVENHDLVKYYKNASKYSVKLLDDVGSPLSGVNVTFNINGVFYNRLTDSNGVASLAINLNPGDYIITAEYGDSRVSNNIKVLSVIESEDITMHYRDGTSFKAKILDGLGNPNPGVDVVFNINGVFYTKTTDSTGVASLKINLQAGKYIITSTYNGLSASNTIVIKSI